jgi:hypothetical protein
MGNKKEMLSNDYFKQRKCEKYMKIINHISLELEKVEGIKYIENFYFVFPEDFKDCIPNLNKSKFKELYCNQKKVYYVNNYK